MHARDCIVHLTSDVATAKRQIPDSIFWSIFFTSLRKDRVANYASIWMVFSPTVRGLDVAYFATYQTFRSSVGRWRHKIRKFAAEIFQNAKKSAADLCQILRMVTIGIVINSTRVMGIRVTISCRYCIAFEVMFVSYFRPREV